MNALGHSDPGVQAIISNQSGILIHNSNLWHNEWAGELALLLVDATKQLGGLGYAPTGVSYQSESEPAAGEEVAEVVDGASSGLKVGLSFTIFFDRAIS